MAINFLNTATGITEAVGDNSTKIATTAYADAAASAIPIGNYLPLSAGSSKPLTAALYIPHYIYHVGDTGTFMGFPANDRLIIGTNGVTRVDITNSGFCLGDNTTNISVSTILDEDDMASDSATALVTQQSIKAYVDAHPGSGGTVTSVSGTGSVSGLTLTGTVTSSGDLTLGGTISGFTPLNDIRSLGTPAFTNGTNPNITTAQVMAEIEGDGGFDSYSSVFKTSWSYAGNYNLTDAGDFTETAGSSWLTWTDNSSDSTRGNITTLAIAPNTGGSAGGVFIYNDQGASYSPGWRQVWTSTTDGAGSGLDADLLDGQEGSYYATAASLGNYLPIANPTFTGTLTGPAATITTVTGALAGNASSATTLQTARTIAGVSFDGSANISLNNNAITNGAGYITSASLPTVSNGQIDGRTSGLGLGGSMDATANQSGNTTFTVTSNAVTAATANTIAYRDSSADLNVRLLRANYANQSTIGGAMAFRVNNGSDNYLRYCSSPSAIRTFLGASASSDLGNYLPLGGGAMTGNIQMNSQIFATAGNYGRGVFGLYDASKYQHVWSMGTAFKLADNGASTGTGGNLYGLAWSYNPGYGGAGNNAQSKAGLNHQLLLMMNGTTKFAAGNGMWTSGNATIEGTMIANQIKLMSGTTAYLNTSSYSSSAYIYGYATGSTIYFGQPATWTQNIQVQGTATATNFILSSDKTLKNKIKEIDTNHIDVNWKNFELKSEPGVKRAGVIAQELEEKHPEFVRTDDEGIKSVAYIDLLITKIAELEARLEKAGI